MILDLTGKKALVTGSTQGIGKAIAAAFLESGAEVFLHGSRDIAKCQRVAEEFASKGWTKMAYGVADLSKPDGAQNLYAQVKEKLGNIDILVLNASVQYRNPWAEIPPEEMETQLQVNFKSSFTLIQLTEPAMEAKGWGRILTVGSVQQYKPHKDMMIYAASKCAQMSMVQNLAKQISDKGITVNNLSPGVIATPRNDAALSDPDYSKKVLAGIPCGYAGTAEDCAGAAVLLCSEQGRYITGTDLIVDGGMHL